MEEAARAASEIDEELRRAAAAADSLAEDLGSGTAILGTALHTFLFFSKVDLPIVRYKESLIVKLLFWPVVLGLPLAVAVVVVS